MRLLCLHPFGRYGPGLRIDVDLLPSRTADFARSCRGRDCELQRLRAFTFNAAQPCHELRHLCVGQGAMMSGIRDLAWGRQHHRQMPLPARRVQPRAVAAHRCPVEDGFEAAA